MGKPIPSEPQQRFQCRKVGKVRQIRRRAGAYRFRILLHALVVYADTRDAERLRRGQIARRILHEEHPFIRHAERVAEKGVGRFGAL